MTSFAFYLFGWFIFTFLLWILTLRSTVAFCFLFFTLMLAFLMLALAYLMFDAAGPNIPLLRAGGAFGIIAAFAAWYVAQPSSCRPMHPANMDLGTTPWPVWQTPATRSSSSQLPTSHGPRRDVSDVERLTTALSARHKHSRFRGSLSLEWCGYDTQ